MKNKTLLIVGGVAVAATAAYLLTRKKKPTQMQQTTADSLTEEQVVTNQLAKSCPPSPKALFDACVIASQELAKKIVKRDSVSGLGCYIIQ